MLYDKYLDTTGFLWLIDITYIPRKVLRICYDKYHNFVNSIEKMMNHRVSASLLLDYYHFSFSLFPYTKNIKKREDSTKGDILWMNHNILTIIIIISHSSSINNGILAQIFI